MITVFEKTEHLNIIHCVMGEPTDMQMDFEGAIMIDISPMIADVNPNNPIVLKLNRCQNEDRLATKLTMDKMMREQLARQNNPMRGNMVKGKCPKCGRVAELQIVNGHVQPCKECQVLDSHLQQKPQASDKEVTVELNEMDKKLIQSIANQSLEKKKPIRKKRPVAKREGEYGKDNIQ